MISHTIQQQKPMSEHWFDAKLKSERRSMKFNELPNELRMKLLRSSELNSVSVSPFFRWMAIVQYVPKKNDKETPQSNPIWKC